jgi:Tol biopolymer transport system component
MTDRMNRADSADVALASWLAIGPEQGPAEGLEAALAATRQVSQRPAWTFPGRWIPVDAIGSRLDRRVAAIALAVLTLTLLAIATLYVVVGSVHRLPPPFGPAANGVIAYDTGRGGGVWIADGDGRNPHRVMGDGIERSPAFSPDGTLIAYWSRPVDDLSAPGPALECGCTAFHLYVAKADGSSPHLVAGGQWFNTDPYQAPVWSPDSKALALDASTAGIGQIWVVHIDDQRPAVPITTKSASSYRPAWSPNGAWIAFAEQVLGAAPTHSIAVARPDGNDYRQLHRQAFAQSVDDEAGFGGSLVWSPDSREIAYDRGRDPAKQDEHDYWVFLVAQPLDGPERLVEQEPSGWLGSSAFSPDGSRIAYVTGYPNQVVRVANVDGSGSRAVGGCPEQFVWLHWSPDGRWLTSGCPGNPQLVPSTDAIDVAPPIALPANAQAIDVQRVAP